MADGYARIRVVSPDGLAHTSTVLVVAADGTETPIEDVVTRVDLTCDSETGIWKAVLCVEQVSVDVVVDDIDIRPPAARSDATEEN